MKKYIFLFLISVLCQQINGSQTGGPVIFSPGSDCPTQNGCPNGCPDGKKCVTKSTIYSGSGMPIYECQCVKK